MSVANCALTKPLPCVQGVEEFPVCVGDVEKQKEASGGMMRESDGKPSSSVCWKEIYFNVVFEESDCRMCLLLYCSGRSN